MTSIGVNIAILKTNEILLIKREDFEVWCLPGGGLDPGESFALAAIRETQEETGLKVELDNLVGIYSRTSNGKLYDHIVVFAAHPIGGSLQPQVGEALDVRFFNQNELPTDIVTWHRRRILDAFSECSGLAWRQNYPLGFDPPLSREDLYELRDRSLMSRFEFFHKHINVGGDDFLEVGNNAFKE